MPCPLLPSGHAREDTRGDEVQRSENDVISSIGGVALYLVKIKYDSSRKTIVLWELSYFILPDYLSSAIDCLRNSFPSFSSSSVACGRVPQLPCFILPPLRVQPEGRP